MPTNDEIIPIEDALKEIRSGLYLKTDCWENNEVAKVVEMYYNKARSDQKEIDGVNMVGKYWSNKAKERIERDERQRCIDELYDIQMKLRQELTTYKDNIRYGYVEAEKKIRFIDELVAKLSEKVD